jgi:hypothetical protein
MSMHAPARCSNHTAGEVGSGDQVREHIGAIFETWPDIHFDPPSLPARRRRHRSGPPRPPSNTMRRGDLLAEPTGKKIEWRGIDVIPYEDGQVKRKDVYSDSVSILRQVGLLE